MSVTIISKGIPYTASTAARAQALAAKDSAPAPSRTTSSSGGGGSSAPAPAPATTSGDPARGTAGWVDPIRAPGDTTYTAKYGTPTAADIAGANAPGVPTPVTPVPVAPAVTPVLPVTNTPADATAPNTATTPGNTTAATPPNVSAGLAPTVNLTPGQSGPEVTALQNYLVSQGYMTQDQVNTGPGIYGPQTKAAVAQLQSDLGVNAGPDAGYYGPQTQEAIAKGSGSGTDGSPASPGSTAGTYDNTGATPTTPEKSAIQQVIDDYTTAYKSLGLGDVKAEYDNFVQQKTQLENDTNAKISDVNNNPWLSQGIRDKQVARITDDAKTSLDTLTNQISLLDAMYKQGQAEVDTIVTKAEAITAEQVKAAATIADQKQKAIDALTLASTKASAATKTVAGGSTLVDANGKPIYTAPKIANPKSGGGGGKTGTPSAAQIATGEAKLKASRGPDGYVDPTVYQQAYNDWPGTSASFLSKYPPKDYVNPANTWLPSYLRPAASKSSSTVTNPFK